MAQKYAQPPQYLRGMNDIQPYCPKFASLTWMRTSCAPNLVYMEQARIHWWRQAVGGSAWDWTKIGVLVAHHTIDYQVPFNLATRWRCHASQGTSEPKA